MAITLVSKQFKNQILNGEDFTLNPSDSYGNLVASVGDFVQTKQIVRISWKAETDGVNAFVVQNPPAIFRQAGSWIGDQFNVGDVIDLYDTTTLGSPVLIFAGRTITSIANDTIELDGASFTTELGYKANAAAFGKTPMEAARFRYGIIGNSDSASYVSKVDGLATQLFSVDQVISGAPSSIQMTRQPGVESWHDDGIASLKYLQTLGVDQDFAQEFELTHTFRFLPYYLDGDQSNLQSLVPPTLFNQFFKYVFRIDFSPQLSSLYTKSLTVTNVNGLTGWFDQNPIGLNNQFSIGSVQYQDVASGQTTTEIDIQNQTQVTLQLLSANSTFDSNTPFILWLSYLPAQADYQQNFNTVQENFLFDSCYQDTGATAKAGLFGIVSDVVGTFINTGEITITFKTDYNTAQQLQATDGDYFIAVTTKTDSLGASENDQAAVIADVNKFQYSTDVENLMFVDLMEFYPHDLSNSNPGFTDFKGWIEDGFLMQSTFKMNIDEPAKLVELKATLSAYNEITEDRFDLDEVIFDMTGIVTVGNTQQITINNTRGFKLHAGSQFNLAVIKQLSTSLVGSINVQEYEMQVSFRARFEEWIAQSDADPVFFNALQQNNGLNKLISNFDSNGYKPKVIITGLVEDSNGVQTIYNFVSQDLDFNYYEQSTHVSGTIELFDINDNAIGEILNNGITKVKATFSDYVNPSLKIIGAWAHVHLYIKDQGNYQTVDELSSIYPSVANNPLIPLSGESFVKITDTGTEFIVECMINSIYLPDPNAEYSIAVRIGPANVAPEGKTTEAGDLKTTEGDEIKSLD